MGIIYVLNQVLALGLGWVQILLLILALILIMGAGGVLILALFMAHERGWLLVGFSGSWVGF